MVYLNNDNNKQDVYIPRNDGHGSYVSPCDKCYQEGYNDGCEECGNVNLEDKSVVVTAATQTVLPSSGYDAMTSVDVDATEWGQSKYDEGYDEGYGNGEDDQKARLSSATFVENGHYELENGWSAVTVQTTCPPCPEPSLENKTVELESGTTLPAAITPSSGYDGFGEVTIEDNGYGDKKYDDGFSDGQDDIRNNMSSTAFTQNGNYSNSSGWSAVTVNVPTSGGSNLQNKSVVLTAGTQTVLPDAGYDGMTEVDIDATDLLNDEHAAAYSDGYSEGVDAVRNQFTTTAVTQNGTYQMTGELNAFSSFTVTVPPSCTLQTKNDTMTASTQTFTADNLVRPTAPSGETVYGGSIELLEDLIDQYGQIRIKAWDNAQHSDSTLVGYFKYDNGEYMWYFFQGDIPYPFSSLTSSFANVGGVWGSCIYMENDGRNIFFYDDFTNGIFLDGGLTLNDLILPVDGYDGLSAVTVSASALCQDYYSSGYTSGYTDGQADCPSCNMVSDFKTIVTGTDETVCVGFSRPSAPSGETVYGGSYAELKSMIDNWGDIVIFSFDDQAHSDETEEGYFVYRNDQYIYYNYQGDISFPLDEIGPRWTNTGNNDKFFLWNDGMNIFFYTRYEYGWETNYVILPPESLILELADGDAAECIHIDSSEVYESGRQAGYDDGYNTGTSDAETENSALYYATDNQQIVNITSAVMYSDFDGTESVNITENIAVFSHNGQLSPPPVSRYSYCRVSVDNQINTLWRLVFDPNERQHITRLWLPDPMFSCWMRTETGIFYSGLFCEGLTNLQELYLPRNLTRLYGLNDTNSLENLILPAKLSVIRKAFKNSGVKVVNLPNSVGEIGMDVFRSSAVEKLIFHETCWIGSGSFRGDAAAGETGTTQTPALKEIYCYMEYAPIMSNNAGGTIIDPTDADAPFGAQAQNGTLYCPQGKAANYQTFLSYLPSGWTISATL